MPVGLSITEPVRAETTKPLRSHPVEPLRGAGGQVVSLGLYAGFNANRTHCIDVQCACQQGW
jgi:hypothetical protein